MADDAGGSRRALKKVEVAPRARGSLQKRPEYELPRQSDLKNWRRALAAKLRDYGIDVWDILLDIAQGKVVVPRIETAGQVLEGPPIIPTSSDRLNAARELAHALYGKPVPQTDIAQAENAASDLEELNQLSYEQIKQLAAKILTDEVKATAEEAEVEEPS